MTQREITALKQKAELYEMAFDCAVVAIVAKSNLTHQESVEAIEKVKKRILQSCKDELNVCYRIMGYPII